MTADVTAPSDSGQLAGKSSPENADDSRHPQNPDGVQTRRHRRDIDGLRAFAVTLVVLFHAGVPYLNGGFIGVDVFFVISGFLITGLLLREGQQSATVSIRGFYARRVRRLLPLATVVLLAVVAASAVLIPLLHRAETSTQINSASLFYSNWLFASTEADYWAGGVGQSPVLHFWSLSVEEQYYVIVPLLLLAVLRWCKWRGTKPAALLFAVLAAVAVGSFALSALTSQNTGGWAYYGLQTRAWELAAGGLIAICAGRLGKIAPRIASAMMWAGVAVIVFSAFWITQTMAFPGTVALLPVGGAALVLAGGCSRTADVPVVLSAGPIRQIGLNSYSWYLWHWPIFVFAGIIAAVPAAAAADGHSPVTGVSPAVIAALIVGSLAVAIVTTRWIERPLRAAAWLRVKPGRSLAVGAAMIAVTVAASVLMLAQPVPKVTDGKGIDPIAAATLTTPAELPAGLQVPLTQEPKAAIDDKAPSSSKCFRSADADIARLTECSIGAKPAPGNPVVVLVGDSHARMWSGTIGQVGKDRGWTVYAIGSSGCKFLMEMPDCPEFRQSVTAQLKELPRLDLLLVGRRGDILTIGKDPAANVAVIESRLRDLGPEIASKTVIIDDTENAPQRVPECVRDHLDDFTACSFQHAMPDPELRAQEAAAIAATGYGVRTLDFTDLVCPTGATCPAVDVNGTIIYRDTDHVTNTFALSLWKLIGQRLDPLVG